MKVKKQHYVPQFYLRHFADSNESLLVYDKPSNKSFRQSVSEVAQDKYFYDVEELDERTGIDQFLEKFFHPIEQDAAKVIADLLDQLKARRFVRLSDDSRATLSVFLAVQFLRTLESRNHIVEMMEKMSDVLFRQHLKIARPDLAGEDFVIKVDDARKSHVHAKHLLNLDFIDELAGILRNHLWFVLINTSGVKYYTSDNPLVKHPHLKHPIRSMNGLASKGIEIFFPISPDYAIDIAERTFFSTLPWPDATARPVRNSDFVTFHNSLQVIHSTRQVFSLRDDFALAREMCSAHPELANPLRSRVTVA